MNDYNEKYFYLTFETKAIWIILGMIVCLFFNGGVLGVIALFLYLCYGFYRKKKIIDEINANNKK